MKLIRILKKNFKLLLRSKMTALVVVVAPLLIILLAGIAFNNNETTKEFKIGVFQEEQTTLATDFMTQLESSNFSITEFNDLERCKNSVKESLTQACIVFPQGFSISDTSQAELQVFADYSRQNFVFYLMETISASLEVKTSEVSLGLTEKLLGALTNAKAKNEEANLQMVQLKSDLDAMQVAADKLNSDLQVLNTEKETVAIGSVSSSMTSLKSDIKSLRDRGINVLVDSVDAAEAALDVHPDLADWNGENETYDMINEIAELNETSIESAYNTSITKVDSLISGLNAADENVKKMEDKLAKVKDFKSSGSASLADMKSKIATGIASAEAIKASLEAVNQNIDQIDIKTAQTIIEPIKTTVQPVITDTNSINYMFSYLLVLIVMFVSILLASTFIVMEKKSKAYFRNFSTPTSDFTFIMATYITNIIIVLLQLLVLFVLGYFVLNIPVINNIHLSVTLLFVAITLFTAIGMGIGYWFSSQEAAIMLSMSIASVFLLVSNLILPLEVMPPTIQTIAAYNPYVMISELLRQFMIFNIIPEITAFSMSILAIAAIVIFLLIIFIQKVSKFAFFQKQPHTKKTKKAKKIDIKQHKAFKLYERTIENEIDLLNELKNMDDATFTTYVNKDKNDFYNWAKYMLKDKKLASRLKVKTRQEMINAIEKQ